MYGGYIYAESAGKTSKMIPVVTLSQQSQEGAEQEMQAYGEAQVFPSAEGFSNVTCHLAAFNHIPAAYDHDPEKGNDLFARDMYKAIVGDEIAAQWPYNPNHHDNLIETVRQVQALVAYRTAPIWQFNIENPGEKMQHMPLLGWYYFRASDYAYLITLRDAGFNPLANGLPVGFITDLDFEELNPFPGQIPGQKFIFYEKWLGLTDGVKSVALRMLKEREEQESADTL
jgi:hypothetical protein